MIRKSLLAIVVLCSLAVVCQAAAVDGRWEGTVSGPNGDFALVFNFKADGEKLTGTVAGPGGEIPISDGKIKGDDLTFKVQVGDDVITHEGKLEGETIKIKSHAPWGDAEFTLKRAAKKTD
jgi:hypothetical protein